MTPWVPEREELAAIWRVLQDLLRDVADLRRRLDLHHPNPNDYDEEGAP